MRDAGSAARPDVATPASLAARLTRFHALTALIGKTKSWPMVSSVRRACEVVRNETLRVATTPKKGRRSSNLRSPLRRIPASSSAPAARATSSDDSAVPGRGSGSGSAGMRVDIPLVILIAERELDSTGLVPRPRLTSEKRRARSAMALRARESFFGHKDGHKDETMIAMLALLTAFAACPGADPAITNVTTSQTSNGGLTTYTLRVTVPGEARLERASAAMCCSGSRDPARPCKERRKGCAAVSRWRKVHVPIRRAARPDAAAGTTTVDLHLVMHQPAGMGPQDCSATNDSQRVKL